MGGGGQLLLLALAALAATAAAQTLPAGWGSGEIDGKTYYYHNDSPGEILWDPPPMDEPAAAAAAAAKATEAKQAATGASAYLAWFAVLLLRFVLGDDSGLFQHIDEDDVPFWSFSLLQVSFATFCLAWLLTVVGFAGSILCRGVAALCRAMGITNCSCFEREIAMLRACCCPQKNAATTVDIRPTNGTSGGTASRDSINPMFGLWTCVKAELNGESVTEYTGHEMTVPDMGAAFPAMMNVRRGSGDPEFWSTGSYAGRDVYTITCVDWQARWDGTYSFGELHPDRSGQFAVAPLPAAVSISNDLSMMEIQCDLGASTQTVWERKAPAPAAGGQAPTPAAGGQAPAPAAGPVPVKLSDVQQQQVETLIPTNRAPQAYMPVVIAVPVQAARP
jgi:hypothetical protein